MRLVSFFRSPTGNIALFCAFVGLGGILVFRSNARERMHGTQMTRVASAPAQTAPRETITRNGLPFRQVAMVKQTSATVPAVADEADGRAERLGRRRQQPEKPRVLPISLFTAAANA